MEVPVALIEFLSTVKAISIGEKEITFFKPKDIVKEQIGYRCDTNGKDLTGRKRGGWKKSWIVFGCDDLGDPLFIDTMSPTLSVFTAMHGVGSWTPILIADSLDNLKLIISNLRVLSKGRTNPVAIENNPISDSERKSFLTLVRRINLYADIHYWDLMIEYD